MTKAEELLQDLVEHARPSFPGTPFRKALVNARNYLKVVAEAEKLERCAMCITGNCTRHKELT